MSIRRRPSWIAFATLCGAIGCERQAPAPVLDAAAQFSFRFGTSRAAPFLLTGWSPPEGAPDNAFQWSNDNSSRMHFALRSVPAHGMWIAAEVRPADVQNQRIAIGANGTDIDVAALRTESQWVQGVVPAAVLHPGTNVLDFRYAVVARPIHHHLASTDVRRLGVLWQQFRAAPLGLARAGIVGNDSGNTVLRSGWGDVEPWGAAHAVWGVGAASTVDICLAPQPGTYALVIRARVQFGPTTIPVFIDGHVIGTLVLDGEMRDHYLMVGEHQIQPGHNLIEFRYAHPFQPAAIDYKATDNRLLGMQVSRVALVPISSLMELSVGVPARAASFSDGWSSPEPTDQGQAAWSDGPLSGVSFELQPLLMPYRLSAFIKPIATVPPIKTQVTVNGQRVGEWIFTQGGWQFATLELPAGMLVRGQNRLEFQYSQTVVPHDRDPANADLRKLAVRIHQLQLTPSGEL